MNEIEPKIHTMKRKQNSLVPSSSSNATGVKALNKIEFKKIN